MRFIPATILLCACVIVSVAASATPSIAQDPEWYRQSISLQGRGVADAATERGSSRKAVNPVTAQIIPHPPGCPARLFCGCGAAVRVFGSGVRSLWLAKNWFQFPRSSPGSGMVAVSRRHVFVLESHVGGDQWIASDYNSGGRLSRLHVRSIAGYVIVNPRAINLASIRP